MIIPNVIMVQGTGTQDLHMLRPGKDIEVSGFFVGLATEQQDCNE
jgi:hypothetical protein